MNTSGCSTMIKVIYIGPEDAPQIETYVSPELLETFLTALLKAGCQIIEVRE